jgi:hypothetical protein
LLAQARIGEQLLQLGLSGGAAIKVGAGETVAAVPKLPPLAKNLETLTDTLKQQKAELDAQLKKQADELKSLRDFLDSRLKKEVANATQQIEAFVSIQNYLSTGVSLPRFHDWAISPDLGLFLIERIRERRYDQVIEFGSGTSTVLFAQARRVEQRNVPICAFEHDLDCFRKTASLLRSSNLPDGVELHYAPLTDWQDETGSYRYYDCDGALNKLARRLGGEPKRLLVFVDGPPGKTCANARYPAIPAVFKHLGQHEIDVVLDDAGRPEEQSVISLWRAFWKQHTIFFAEQILPSEKGIYWARNYEV